MTFVGFRAETQPTTSTIVTHHPTDCVNRLHAFSGKRYPDRHRINAEVRTGAQF